MLFRSDGGLRLLQGADRLTRYTFHSHKNEHYFCSVCGVRPFGIGTETPLGRMYGVNIGCLEGIEEAVLAGLPVTFVDGLHDRWQQAPEFTAHL